MVLLRVNNNGAATALAFFGFSTLLGGFLVFRSTYLPRWLGVLGMIAALGWLTFIYPPLGYRVFMFAALFGPAGRRRKDLDRNSQNRNIARRDSDLSFSDEQYQISLITR